MIIQQKRIRSLKGRLPGVRKGTPVVVGARLVPDLMPKLRRIGFPDDANIGDSVLPSKIGPVSLFNAEGAIVIHRNRPMETVFRQVEWHWTQFQGRFSRQEQSKIVDVPYKRFPRTHLIPPSVELRIGTTAEGERVLLAPQITFTGEDNKNLIHIVNLFLEILGFCEFFTNNIDNLIQAPVRRLNWRLLPSGKRAWKDLRPEVLKVVSRAEKGNQPVIEHRLEEINRFKPNFFAIGHAGFAGYVVFGFTERNIFIFESVYTGNATYVFGSQWEKLSQLTKMQILDGRLHLDRIFHRAGWEKRLQMVLQPPPKGGKSGA